jgi:hypothetical protein
MMGIHGDMYSGNCLKVKWLIWLNATNRLREELQHGS